MGGTAIHVLPRDSELARRAAGGDGTAFVRLYDRYSADVFEATLGRTHSVELAADATQAAFLNLLQRPPAIDAPDRDVIDRLQAMALAASAQWRPPAGGGVGWLRSETVAKAGARFQADWSAHLTGADTADRTLAEVAFAWQATEQAPAERVVAEQPVAVDPVPEPADRPARRRRFTLLSFLPARPAFAVPGALGAAAAALALLAGSGDDAPSGERTETLASLDAVRLAPLSAIADRPERPEPPRARRPAPTAGGETVAVAYHPSAASGDRAGDVSIVPAPSPSPPARGRGPATGGRGPAAAETLGVTQEVPAPRGTGRLDPPATVPAPPQRPPAASPAPPAEATPPSAPTPAEPRSLNGGGVRRNCNSPQSLSPC